MKKFALALIAAACSTAATGLYAADTAPAIRGTVVTASQVQFQPIMPDAVWFGTVYGDRASGPHGTFVKIKKGAATPSHTHSRSYFAVILAGQVENPMVGTPDSSKALGAGSYYDVPANVDHVTRCAATSPEDCMTFFVQDGAFDFVTDLATSKKSLDLGHTRTADQIKFDPILPGDVWFGTAMGDRSKGPHGTFVKIRKGAATPAHVHSGAYRAVVLAGEVQNPIPANQANPATLTRGSYYDVPANADHITRCQKTSPTDCLTFFYQPTPFDFTPTAAK